MHFEVLVEDQSGKKALDCLIPKIIAGNHTFKVRSYKGIGSIPKGLQSKGDPSKRILLDQLPRLLQGYGQSFQNYEAAVIVVCDLDNRDQAVFLDELNKVLHACQPQPITRFCLSVEEGEAWLLGDLKAVKQAYPSARSQVLNNYTPDAICGTWELLADAVYKGGAKALKKGGWQAVGREKSIWSEKITPHMVVQRNISPSFRRFLHELESLMN